MQVQVQVQAVIRFDRCGTRAYHRGEEEEEEGSRKYPESLIYPVAAILISVGNITSWTGETGNRLID